MCRLHRELHGGRGVDQARAGDERIAEGQRRLLQDLLRSRERQIGVRLQHVGDHAGNAWRRSRGAEKRIEPWNGGVDVVDAGDCNRIINERPTGNGRAIVIEPELRPGPGRREVFALERAAQARSVLRIHRSHRERVGGVYVTLRGARVCTVDRD